MASRSYLSLIGQRAANSLPALLPPRSLYRQPPVEAVAMAAETATRGATERSPAAVTRAVEPPTPLGAAVREALPPRPWADVEAPAPDPLERDDTRPTAVGDRTPPTSARTIPLDTVEPHSPASRSPTSAVPERTIEFALVSTSSGGTVRKDPPTEVSTLPASEGKPIRWRAPRDRNDPMAVRPPRQAPTISTAVTGPMSENVEILPAAPATPMTRGVSAKAGLEVQAPAPRAQPSPRLRPSGNPTKEGAGPDVSRVHIGSIEVQVVQPPSSPPTQPPRGEPGASWRSSARAPSSVGALSRGFRSFGLTQG